MFPQKFWFIAVLALSLCLMMFGGSRALPQQNNQNLPQDMKPFTLLKKCYELLGCFNIDPISSGLGRHCGFPTHPNLNQIFVFFHSKKTHGEIIYRYPDVVLDNVSFNPKGETYVILPGSNSSQVADWVVNVRKFLVDKKNANVLVVDWVRFPFPLNNLIVCGLIRTISSEISAVLLTMHRQLGLDIGKTHCMGHSVGAQICGFVGKNTSGLMASITGIDASAVFFEGFPKDIHLAKGDARFVVAIHAASAPTIPFAGMGFTTPYADVDFYFNGGLVQPKCIQDAKELKLWNPISCHHQMATYYYMESVISSNCTFWGKKTSFQAVTKGLANGITAGKFVEQLPPSEKCIRKGNCLPVGLDTEKYPGRGVFFVTTRREAPFCNGDEEYLKQAALYNDPGYQHLDLL